MWSLTRAKRWLISVGSAYSPFLHLYLLSWQHCGISVIALHNRTCVHVCMCSLRVPRAMNHSGITPLSFPTPIPTPTKLIPGACFARSATLPTHALTLLVPASCGEHFSCFLLSTPTHSKRLWITGWHTEAPAGLLCFRWRGTSLSFLWFVKHSPKLWGLTCT